MASHFLLTQHLQTLHLLSIVLVVRVGASVSSDDLLETSSELLLDDPVDQSDSSEGRGEGKELLRVSEEKFDWAAEMAPLRPARRRLPRIWRPRRWRGW